MQGFGTGFQLGLNLAEYQTLGWLVRDCERVWNRARKAATPAQHVLLLHRGRGGGVVAAFRAQSNLVSETRQGSN